MKPPPRVVLDTNVVLSALLFGRGPTARVRVGWQSSRFVPLASTATAHQLVRVLAYPRFGLSAEEQSELLADFMPWVTAVQVSDPPPAVPRCRDPHDQIFLELAEAGNAQWLVTGDRDLLALQGQVKCNITTAAEFVRDVLGRSPL